MRARRTRRHPHRRGVGIALQVAFLLVAGAVVAGLLPVGEEGKSGASAAPARGFSVVVIGDTQFYAASASRSATYRAMARWVVAQRGPLGIVFVTNLGDITDAGADVTQWRRASAAQQILDSAGVPNAVVRGNHDVRPGPVLFDRFFPPSRYASQPWYGGYLGDRTDPVADGGLNDLDKNSYQLVTAPGVALLFLSLDVDPTAAEVAWAGRVMDAYPQRSVIISTHKFLSRAGSRFPAAQTLWNRLVYPATSGRCRRVLVILSGHDPGEGRRADRNACGRPVYQLRSDFQGKPNGGDGWLRILQFHPASNRIDVRTYSPTLGRFDADTDSQFSLLVTRI